MITFILHDVVDGDLAASGLQAHSSFHYKISSSHFKSFLETFGSFTHKKRLNVTDLLVGKEPPEILLTFDDGGKSAITQIDPLLRDFGWIGHFFVTTKFIGQTGFLDRGDIQELSKRGHIIGSHSHTHPASMATLDADTLQSEWQVSIDILSEILGTPVTTASVPEVRTRPELRKQRKGLELKLFLLRNLPEKRNVLVIASFSGDLD